MIKKMLLRIKKFFKSFFIKSKNMLFYDKKSRLSLLFALCSLFASCLLVMTGGLTDYNNKTDSYIKIINEYLNMNSDEQYGALYYEQTSNEHRSMVFPDANRIQNLRTEFYQTKFINVYPSNLNGEYSPCVVNYGDRVENVSLLLWPKFFFLANEFLYKMPLIEPKNIENLSSSTNNQEIYINSKYAQELVENNVGSTFQDLLGKNIVIPYKSPTLSNYPEANTFLTDSSYTIKGIIDNNSVEYEKYSKIFGEFFLINEYASLPIPHVVYFEFTQSNQLNNKIIKKMFDIFDYSIDLKFGTSVIKDSFECKMTIFEKIDNESNINNIGTNKSDIDKRINYAYDFYNYSEIFHLLPVIGCIVFGILFLYFVVKSLNKNYFGKKSLTCLFACLFFSLNVISLLSLGIFYLIVILSSNYLNPINWKYFVLFYFSILILIVLYLLFLYFKNNYDIRRKISIN